MVVINKYLSPKMRSSTKAVSIEINHLQCSPLELQAYHNARILLDTWNALLNHTCRIFWGVLPHNCNTQGVYTHKFRYSNIIVLETHFMEVMHEFCHIDGEASLWLLIGTPRFASLNYCISTCQHFIHVSLVILPISCILNVSFAEHRVAIINSSNNHHLWWW